MSKKQLLNYLIAERKRWALSQKTVSRLLGRKDPSYTGRIERGRRAPGLKIALSLQVLFGKSLREVYRGLYAAVEEEVIARVYKLNEEVKHREDEEGKRKAKFCQAVFKRAIDRVKREDQ